MKCAIPEISWHNREPVLSVDIQPVSDNFYRLATGGADCHVLIWQLVISENGAVKVEALSDLTRHQRAVNVVKWSPNGQYLATADDDANIIIWHLKTDNIPLLEGETNDKETWIVNKVVRGHKEDIYDLCWSPNGLKLLTGSIDNTAILWDFTKGKNENILSDHKGFVQGVAWDPKGFYLATISTDRICRIYESSGKQVKCRIQKGILPVPEDHYLHNKEVKYFHDDTFKSFFRRLDFSPDGTLLAVPSGKVEIEDCKKIFNCTHLFSVESWARPIAALPTGKQCSTVVRFCPVMFELHEDGPETLISLPYRMIIAVGTDHDIILYDTQQVQPFAYFKDIHYTRLTDLTWSNDGQLLIASSTDGYCSLVTFESGELGTEYTKEESEVEESTLNISGCEELDKDDNVETKNKKMSFLEKWTVKTPNKSNESKHEEQDNERKRKKENNESVSKRIKPIPVLDNATSTPKRIRPRPVLEKTPTSNQKEQEGTAKSSPLLNFLKKSTTKQKKAETPKISEQPLIVNESEARDAWKCESNEVKEIKTDMAHLDEYTEEFSLHLEDSCSKTSKSEVTDVKTQEDSNLKPDSQVPKEDSRITSEPIVKTDDIENCALSTKSGLDVKQSESETVEKGILKEEKTFPRRVPLITLSSPKHKKK